MKRATQLAFTSSSTTRGDAEAVRGEAMPQLLVVRQPLDGGYERIEVHGGTSSPAPPCSSVSGTLPTAVATTGVPLPSASMIVAGTPSVSDTCTKMWAER